MISVFELFKIGVGPSSSHTVGPMKAAAAFAAGLAGMGALGRVASVEVTLLGSLAFTGRGHATDKAIVLGLSGFTPETVDPDTADTLVDQARRTKRLPLAGGQAIAFDPASAIRFDVVTPSPRHPNTLRLVARDADGAALADETWFSVGGGFIAREGDDEGGAESGARRPLALPLRRRASRARPRVGAFDRGARCAPTRTRCARRARRTRTSGTCSTSCSLAWTEGSTKTGPLPGGLAVERRAKAIFERLAENARRNARPAHEIMDFVSVYAMAVNEENAAGGRVVTAPTNGAAGVVPAVLRYYRDHCGGRDARGPRRFPPDRDGDRRPVQAQRLDLRGGGRLPGGGRRRLVHGRGGPLRGPRRLERAGRERRRDRDGASPRHDLRSGRRPRPDPLHRAQRLRRRESHRRRLPRPPRRRPPPRFPRQRHQRPCARPGPTCSRNTRRRALADWR